MGACKVEDNFVAFISSILGIFLAWLLTERKEMSAVGKTQESSWKALVMSTVCILIL